jgi:hypothetical protein
MAVNLFGTDLVVFTTAYAPLDVLFLARITDSSHKTFGRHCYEHGMFTANSPSYYATCQSSKYRHREYRKIPRREGATLLVLNAALQVRVSGDPIYTVQFDTVFVD